MKVIGLLLVIAGTMAPSPGAAPDGYGLGARALGNAVGVWGNMSGVAQEGNPAGPKAAARSAPVRARKLVPLPCYQPGAAICGRDAQACPPAADNTPQTLYWIFTGPPGVANPTADQWQLTEDLCLTPAQAAQQAGEGAPVLTAEQFRRLPLPAGVVHVQPGNGRTLVNVPTNVYVEARTVTLPTTVLGRAVQVRATPVGYAWTFGDGAHLDTHDPGAPYPDLRTTHTYIAPGTRRLTLATTYRGEYSVDGAPWLPVDGTATVTGPAVALTVVATRSELVADPLPT